METVIDTQNITDAGFDEYLSKKIAEGTTSVMAQTLYTNPNSLVGGVIGSQGVLYLGSEQIRLDGKNKNMVWNDGTEDVMTIGQLSNGTFGIDIADGKINGNWITAGTITASQIASGTITATQIASGAISTDKLAAGAVTANKIASGTITATQIASGAIDTDELATGAVTADKIEADAVTASKINVTNLAAINTSLGNVTAGVLTVNGGSSSYITIARGGGVSSNANLRFTGGSQIWVDSDDYVGIKSTGDRIYLYSTSNLMGLFQYGVGFVSYDDIGCQGVVYPTSDNTYDLGTSTRRWDDVYATNGTIQTSDKRDKEDIKESSLGLDFIKKLIPSSFRRKGKKRRHYGFIAQQVEEVLEGKDFAGLIKDKDSGKYGLRYDEFIAPLVKAVQELSEKVDRLEQEIERSK